MVRLQPGVRGLSVVYPMQFHRRVGFELCKDRSPLLRRRLPVGLQFASHPGIGVRAVAKPLEQVFRFRKSPIHERGRRLYQDLFLDQPVFHLSGLHNHRNDTTTDRQLTIV